MAIIAYRWRVVFDEKMGAKIFGKVSAESKEEARTMVINYLHNPIHQFVEFFQSLSDTELANKIEVLDFERSKEVWDVYTERYGGE